MSASPSARRPNLTAEPSLSLTAPGRASIKASVLTSPCERLTAATHGAPGAGIGRVRIGSAEPPEQPAMTSRSAPCPTRPRSDQPERRRADDAEQRRAVGYQREVDGELVASGDIFLGAIERVDQEEAAAIGRGRQMDPFFRDRAGTSGISRARPSPMIRSAARSASVTGEPSGLPSSTFRPTRSTARIAAPARITRSVKGCSSRAAASRSITDPDTSASLIGRSLDHFTCHPSYRSSG